MSIFDVVSLGDYRERREARLRQTLALHRADGDRETLVLRLWEAVELLGADRGAVIWVDEYGPGLVHVHCLLDLASDQPRRSFAIEPLRSAWEEGIPGLLDLPDLAVSGDRILPEGPRSLCAVALGSDGTRAWFLAADSRTPRKAVPASAAEALMFLAGECASIVLHQDLADDPMAVGEPEPSFEQLRNERFSGWPVLQDLDQEREEAYGDDAISVRFLIARLLRALVDDDFTLDPDFLQHQVQSIRSEVSSASVGGRVRLSWERVLDAVEEEDHGELARAVLELGTVAEDRGHLHGARELDRIAYDIGAAARDLDAAIDAARFLGRVSRRLGEMDVSERWYRVGEDVARSGDRKRGEALVLSGLGHTRRARGNLPEARELYTRVLDLADELSDDGVRARALQNLMVLEKHAGRTDEALRFGWAAVKNYGSESGAMLALADLADIFLRCGELDSAERAFCVVAARTEILDVKILALDALSHIAALRGDLAEFQRRLERLDAEAHEDAGTEVRAQVMLYRGRSFLALGEPDVAERWFGRAVAFTEENGLNQILFEAEAALRTAQEEDGGDLLEKDLPKPSEETMSGIRGPLSTLRAVPAGAAR